MRGELREVITRPVADAGRCGLRAQVGRMLDDPRADGVSRSWAAAWFGYRGLAREADAAHPAADAELRASMEEETRLLVARLLAEDRPLRELVTSTQTAVDARLAAHYGLAAPGGPGFTWVEAPQRGGLLRQGSILTATSEASRTSPVRRGVLVLAQLVCDPPGAPPSDIPPLRSDVPLDEALAAHTANPACARCHATIDPVGLALEGYGVAGELRPTSVAGSLPDGTPLGDADALVDWVAGHPGFPSCMARSLATWALRRPVGAGEACVLDGLRVDADTGLRTLLVGLLTSPVFTHRAEPAAPGEELP